MMAGAEEEEEVMVVVLGLAAYLFRLVVLLAIVANGIGLNALTQNAVGTNGKPCWFIVLLL